MTRVKICGIPSLEIARAALEAGADMIGFVFFRPVRRYIQPELAAQIVRACKHDPSLRGRDWRAVGVFVDSPLDEVNELCEQCDLDLVQLCGEESPDYCQNVARPALRVLRAGTSVWTPDRLAEAQRGYHVQRFMVDAHVEGFYGGTGQAADWRSLEGLMDDKILAGGLRPDNVAHALEVTRPWGVDVSSGVERDGHKDADLVRAFIAQVKSFDRARQTSSRAG